MKFAAKWAGRLALMIVFLAICSGCGDDDPVQPDPPVPAAACIDYRDYLHIAATCQIPSGGGRLGDIAIQEGMAFIANGSGGLCLVDISEPTAAVVVGNIPLPGQAVGVAVAGNYAYVACEASGLQVVDISEPAAPVIVGSVIWG